MPLIRLPKFRKKESSKSAGGDGDSLASAGGTSVVSTKSLASATTSESVVVMC